MAYSRYTKSTDKKALEDAFVAACEDLPHLVAIQSALCDHFVKDLAVNQAPSAGSVVNRVAMMAHLLVHENALPLWEKLHQTPAQADRPAILDQTDGVAGNRLDIAERLLSLMKVSRRDHQGRPGPCPLRAGALWSRGGGSHERSPRCTSGLQERCRNLRTVYLVY